MSRLSAAGRVALLTLALGSIGLTACNTTEGLGRDMQAGGRNLERAADRAK